MAGELREFLMKAYKQKVTVMPEDIIKDLLLL